MPARSRKSSSSGPNLNSPISSSSRPVPATTPYRRPSGSRRANSSNTHCRRCEPSRSADASMVSSYRSVNSAMDPTPGA